MATRKTTKKSTTKKTGKTAASKKTRRGGRPKKATAAEEITTQVETKPASTFDYTNAPEDVAKEFVGGYVPESVPTPEEVEISLPFNTTRNYENRILRDNSYKLQEARREVSRAIRNQNAAYASMVTNTNPYQQEVLSLRFQVTVAEFDVAINNLEAVLTNR